MNREILFRGKRVDNGEWVCGDLLQSKYSDRDYKTSIMEQTPAALNFPVYPETVGQYTGLEDKNGEKIFEGDIVRHISIGRKSTYIVAWDVGSGAFHYKPTKGTGGHRMFVNGSGFAPYEIVGTTHDNPEFLEV